MWTSGTIIKEIVIILEFYKIFNGGEDIIMHEPPRIYTYIAIKKLMLIQVQLKLIFSRRTMLLGRILMTPDGYEGKKQLRIAFRDKVKACSDYFGYHVLYISKIRRGSRVGSGKCMPIIILRLFSKARGHLYSYHAEGHACDP